MSFVKGSDVMEIDSQADSSATHSLADSIRAGASEGISEDADIAKFIVMLERKWKSYQSTKRSVKPRTGKLKDRNEGRDLKPLPPTEYLVPVSPRGGRYEPCDFPGTTVDRLPTEVEGSRKGAGPDEAEQFNSDKMARETLQSFQDAVLYDPGLSGASSGKEDRELRTYLRAMKDDFTECLLGIELFQKSESDDEIEQDLDSDDELEQEPDSDAEHEWTDAAKQTAFDSVLNIFLDRYRSDVEKGEFKYERPEVDNSSHYSRHVEAMTEWAESKRAMLRDQGDLSE